MMEQFYESKKDFQLNQIARIRVWVGLGENKDEFYKFDPMDFLCVVSNRHNRIPLLYRVVRFELEDGGTFCYCPGDGENESIHLEYHEPVLPIKEPLKDNFFSLV